jgi:hypothetical protein
MAQRIPVAAIEEGMILHDDVLTPDGNVLLGAGTALTAKHAGLLERRGIETVSIRAEAEAPPAEELPAGGAAPEEPSEHARAVRRHLEEVFREVRGDPLMETLLELAQARAERLTLPD